MRFHFGSNFGSEKWREFCQVEKQNRYGYVDWSILGKAFSDNHGAETQSSWGVQCQP